MTDYQEQEKVVTTHSAAPGQVEKTTTTLRSAGSPPAVVERKKAIFTASNVLWYLLGVLEVLLAFRFLFRLLGANPASGFVSFIYTLSGVFIAPFRGIFPNVAESGAVLEWATLVAMLVYALIAYGIVNLLLLTRPVREKDVTQAIDE